MEFLAKIAAWSVLFFLAHRLSKKKFQLPSPPAWLVLAILQTVYFLIYFFWNWNRHLSFNSYAFDLSLYLQALENFRLHTPILGKSLLAGHFSPLLLVLVPLFQVGAHPGFLFALQALVLVAATLPLYRVARSLGAGFWPALLVVFVYLNFHLTRHMAFSDFHVENFLPLLLLLLFAAYLEKLHWLYWTSLGLCLLVKEDVGYYLFAASLLLAGFQRERWRQLVLTAGLGLVAGLVTLFLVIRANDGSYPYFSYWSAYGQGVLGIAGGVLKQPLEAVVDLFKPAFWKILFSLGLLPLASVWSLAGLPALWLQLASNQPLQSNLNLYYAAPVLPFLFAGLAEGWVRLEKGLAQSPHRSTLLLGMGLYLAIFNLHWIPLAPVTRVQRNLHATVQSIAPQAKVIAQADVAPHIPGQQRVSVLGLNRLQDADVIVFHLAGNIWPFTRESYLRALNSLRMNPAYAVWKEDSGTVIFIRRED